MGARHVGTQVMTLIAACKDAILFVETLLDKGQMSGVRGLFYCRALLLFVALFFFLSVSGFHGESAAEAMQEYREVLSLGKKPSTCFKENPSRRRP